MHLLTSVSLLEFPAARAPNYKQRNYLASSLEGCQAELVRRLPAHDHSIIETCCILTNNVIVYMRLQNYLRTYTLCIDVNVRGGWVGAPPIANGCANNA